MTTAELFIAFLEREAAVSRRVLERVPDGRQDWKPHTKSMVLGYLATLVATMPGWIEMTLRQDALDLAPRDGQGYQPPRWSTVAELVAVHEQSVERALAALREASEAHLATPWRLEVGGKTVLESPPR